jgi:transposase
VGSYLYGCAIVSADNSSGQFRIERDDADAQFYRITDRRGPKKAACAVAASLLTTIYHMLKDGTPFQDHFDRRSKQVRAKRLINQLAKLGFDAKLTPLVQAA